MYLNKLSVVIFFCLRLRSAVVVSRCVQKLGYVYHQDANTSDSHQNPIVEYEYLKETTSLGNVIKYPKRIYAELVALHPNRSSFDTFFIELKNTTTPCPKPQNLTDLNCNVNEYVYTNSDLVSSLFFGRPDDDYNTVEMYNASSCHRGNDTDSVVTTYREMETNMREYLELGCGALTLDVTVNYMKTDCAQQCQIECNGLGQTSNRPFSFNVDVDLYYYDDDNELVMDPNQTVYRNLTFINAAQADDYASDMFGKTELNGMYKDFGYCRAPKPDTVVQPRKIKNSTFAQQLGHIEVEFVQDNFTVSLGRYECLNLNTPKYNVSSELLFKKGNCVELFDQVDCGSNKSTRVLSGVPQDAGLRVNVLSMRSCCCKFLNCDFEGETYPFVSRRPQDSQGDSRESIHINEKHSCQCLCSLSDDSAIPAFADVTSTIISKTLNYTSCLTSNNSHENLYALIFLNKLQEFKEKRDIKKKEKKLKKAQKKEKKEREKYEKKIGKKVERGKQANERVEREKQEKQKQEKQEKERKEKEKQEKERKEKEKQEKEKQEKEKQKKDKQEKERQDKIKKKPKN